LWSIDPLLGKGLETNNEISDPFLSNGSINTFPRKRDAHNKSYNGNGGVFYLVRAEELKEDNWGNRVQLTGDKSSVRDLSTEVEE
jgi:hypothetical protein